jgi:HAD superfamily hydrolase (TIGR01509 family)
MRLDTVRAALFDIDGTLVDSNDAHARTWVDAFGEAGYDVPFARIRPLIGMATSKIFEALGIDAGDDVRTSIADRRRRLFLEREAPHLHAFAGARALVEAFVQRGITCVVASSASPAERDTLLRIADVADAFAQAVDPDEAGSGKPDPDLVRAALAHAGVSAGEAVMIGDTRYDVESAARAGVMSVALRCGGSDPASLAHADAVYDDPAELADAVRSSDRAAATSGTGGVRESRGMEQSSFGSLTGRAVAATRDFLTRQFETQTHALGAQISRSAGDLNAVAGSLRSSATMSAAAPVAQWASDGIASVGTYLERTPAATLISDFEALARERPAAVVASAATLGFVAARIVKSTSFTRSHGDTATFSDRVAPAAPVVPSGVSHE